MSSETKECLKERLHRLEQDLKENQAFLQTYMLSPAPISVRQRRKESARFPAWPMK